MEEGNENEYILYNDITYDKLYDEDEYKDYVELAIPKFMDYYNANSIKNWYSNDIVQECFKEQSDPSYIPIQYNDSEIVLLNKLKSDISNECNFEKLITAYETTYGNNRIKKVTINCLKKFYNQRALSLNDISIKLKVFKNFGINMDKVFFKVRGMDNNFIFLVVVSTFHS